MSEIYLMISQVPVISTINDSFFYRLTVENIDNDNISTTSGSVITYSFYILLTVTFLSKLIAGK
jgi:hypothetical protein